MIPSAETARSQVDSDSTSMALRSLRNFIEGLSDPTLLLHDNFVLVHANAAARVRYDQCDFVAGMSLDALLSQALPGCEGPDVESNLRHVLAAEGEETKSIFLCHGTRQTHARVNLFRLVEGTFLAVTFHESDKDVLSQRLEFVLDSSTDGIFLVNRHNHIVYFNHACERMTGWKKDSALLQTYECANVLRCHNEAGDSLGADALCPAKVFFNRDSVPKPHEMLITTMEGEERYVETNYSPIRNPNGDVEFIVGIIRDIDERKRLESQLIQSENLALIGQLVSGIAHEIKNPLGILMSSVEIVLNDDRPEDQRREAATYIKEEIRRLDERMKQFLAFAKPKPVHLEMVDIGHLIQRVAVAYQGTVASSTFHVQPQLCSHTPVTLADPDLMHQVFLNLIINAEQSCSKGGIVKIVSEVDGGYIKVRFIDNGQGIEDKDLAQIFNPFFTTKPEGTGLGLSVVHQILMSHRGRIRALNNVGQPGATFEVLLPIVSKGDI